jgi:PAS domain S-box-containing protein
MKNFDLPKDILIQSIEHSNLAHTISSINGDMELTFVNQAFLDTTGYTRDEVVGRNCRFLQGPGTDPATVKIIRQSVAAFKTIDIEILNYKKDGTPFWNHLRMSPIYDEDKNPIAYLGIQSDVTHIHEQLRFEQERQKMEALGRMTGNISHEIKNALQPVKLMAEALKDWKTLSDANIARCIEILADNVEIADKITQDVMRFSRRSSSDLEKINTEDLRLDVIRFVQNLLHGNIYFEQKIHSEPPEHPAFVHIRLNHLYQILINLVNNALYAMSDHGKLILHWGYENIDSAKAFALGLENASYLCIAIEDTGCGMDEKSMRSAFDPFFSTKPPGEGTGLGLSISYRIVKEWNGTIEIQSKINTGSIFTIYLPIKK